MNTINFEDVSDVYVGRDSGCRCGCHGTYTKTSHSTDKDDYSDVDDKKVKRILTRAHKLLTTGEGRVTDSCNIYTNISYGNDRAICIYFNKFNQKLY